ncbi:MAG: insulinase family protein, partial [Acidobacteria bacterium]|nr:insulinase family protein [Acidobacteriota bacterium]
MRSRMLTYFVCGALLPIVGIGAEAPKKTAAAAAPKATASDKILPFKAVEHTLPNGLKVIAVPTGFPNIVSLYIPVRTGSRNEVEAGKSGFAHFFEHMMFRGTEKYSPEKYNAIIQKAGARQNANTSDDRTTYHITFAKDDLEKILEIEADRFKNLSYSPEAFKTEARAVLGEYNKNSASPIRKLFEVQRDAAYTTHTYKHTTMGFIKDIEDMPNQYDYSKTFFSRWYRPENTTIIVAGDVDPQKVFPIVEKYWSDWKRGTYKVDIPVEPPSTKPVYAHVPWPSQTIPWVTVAFRVPGWDETSNELPALDTALDLEFGQTSDLYKRLVEQEQKVDRLFTSNGPSIDPALYTVFARVKDGKDASYVRDEILRTFAKLRDRQEPADRVNESKSNTRYNFVRSLDNTEAITQTLAEFVYYKRSYDTINNYYKELASLTPADLQTVAKKYITDNNLVVTTLASSALPAGIETTPSLASFSASTSAAASSNLRMVSQKSVLPQVEFKLLFGSGSASDPAGKEGLAVLAASMITEAGSKDMTISEINKALYPMAGAWYSQVDKEQTTITGSIHKDNWRNFVDIVLPALLAPGFRDEDFGRLKDAQLNALKQDLRSNNEEELGKERLLINLYPSTPYAHTALGTVAGLNAITVDDVRKFIADNYTRGNLTVGLAGDYPDELVSRLKSDLGALPAGSNAGGIQSLPKIAGHMPSGLEVEIIQKDTRATAISFGRPLPITRADADFAALNVARAWLGEHRASTGRLYNRIREIRGLNYGDYSYIEFFNRPGGQFFPSANIARRSQAFEIWIRPVVPENAHMSLRIALYELQKLIDNGLSEEDFQSTRDYLMKNIYLMTATQDQRLGYGLDSWWYGMPDYTDTMRARYAKLTRADVNNAIKKYLSAKDLSVVII